MNQDKLTVSLNNIRLLVLEVIQKELVDLKENDYDPEEIIEKSEAILSLLTLRERFKEEATAATVTHQLKFEDIKELHEYGRKVATAYLKEIEARQQLSARAPQHNS